MVGNLIKGVARIGIAINGIFKCSSTNPPSFSRATQWLKGGVKEGTTNEINDSLIPQIVDNADYTGNACLRLDGVGDLVNCGNVCASTDIDISIRTLLPSTPAGGKTIFCKGSFGNGSDYVMDISGNNLRLLGYTSSSSLLTVISQSISGIVDDGLFHTVRGTIETEGGNSTLKLFIDGAEVRTATVAGVVRVSANPLMIGARFNVNFADLLLNQAYSPDCFDYSFAETTDDFTLATCYDRSTEGNHATITSTSGLATMRTTNAGAIPWNIDNGFTEVTT